jgi:hypothetical protein
MANKVKSAVSNVAKAIKNNRILMIVCVFIVMGLAVALINYLQDRTIEMFSAYIANDDGNLTELSEQEHGDLHANCKHIDDDLHSTCGGHGHDEDGALLATAVGDKKYTIAESGSLMNEDGNTLVQFVESDWIMPN